MFLRVFCAKINAPLLNRSMNKKPLVSILLPVHNSGRFLRESLQSLTSQKYRNIEIIAIDDKSSDSSYKILKSFKKNHPKKIRLYRNVKRYGIVMTLNRLLRKAKGEFVTFAEGDDIASKNRVKKQLEYLQLNQNIAALGTQCRFLNQKGKLIGKSSFPLENRDIYNSTLHGVSLQFETIMINKNLLPKDILKFNQGALPFIYSDLMIKLLPYGKFANLPNYLHYHRNHPRTYLLDLRNNFISLLKLWAKSNAFYDYQPSIRLLFTSLIRTTIKTV